MNFTFENIKENLSKVDAEAMTLEIYMVFLVEKDYVKIGNKYLLKKYHSFLKENTWEDVDSKGIGADGFDYLMDENQIKQNSLRKENWEKIMKKRLTLEEAFEIAIINENNENN